MLLLMYPGIDSYGPQIAYILHCHRHNNCVQNFEQNRLKNICNFNQKINVFASDFGPDELLHRKHINIIVIDVELVCKI